MASEQHNVPNGQQQPVKVKKVRRGGVVGPTVAILAILALLFRGGMGGIGIGTGSSGNRSGASGQPVNESQQSTDVQQEAEEVPEKVTAAPGVLFWTIEVRESEIYVNDQLVTIDQMKDMLQTAETGSRFVLKENHAIKGTYDSVREALETMGIAYLEGEG